MGTEDASAHFAYSTTLRRHSVEAGHGLGHGDTPSKLQNIGRIVGQEGAGLLDRFISSVAGPSSEGRRADETDSPRHPEKLHEETPSSIYAHYSIEVRQNITFVLLESHTSSGYRTTLSHFSR